MSILMAVRDGERYLPAVLDSLAAQTFPDYELVVVDDASTDRTPTILADYAARDPRIRVLRNREALRLPGSLNRGLDHCRAELVARADADDLYYPERLARQMAFMAAHPEVGVLSCGFRRVDASGAHVRTQVPVTGHERIRFRMMLENCLLHPGVMYRASLVRRVGGYDPLYWTAQDSELWLRLLPLTRFENLPEPLVDYRVHGESTTLTRGGAGRRQSLSVPRRHLSAYLGEDPGEARTEAMVDLFGRYRVLTLAEVREGERGLRQVLHVARHRESPAIQAAFACSVSQALLRQARSAVPHDAGAARACTLLSLKWKPRVEGVKTWLGCSARAASRRLRTRLLARPASIS